MLWSKVPLSCCRTNLFHFSEVGKQLRNMTLVFQRYSYSLYLLKNNLYCAFTATHNLLQSSIQHL